VAPIAMWRLERRAGLASPADQPVAVSAAATSRRRRESAVSPPDALANLEAS
jgi:hypothetical protein